MTPLSRKVVDPGFEFIKLADGRQVLRSLDETIYHLLRRTPKLTSTDVQLLLREHYESEFGLYDHAAPNPDEPFALVAMHPGEENLAHSLLYERIRLFRILEVHKHYGISLKEFFELPPYLTEEILLQCAQEKNTTDTATQEAINRLRSSGILKS